MPAGIQNLQQRRLLLDRHSGAGGSQRLLPSSVSGGMTMSLSETRLPLSWRYSLRAPARVPR